MSVVEKEVVVIGAGISGLATAKCLMEDGFDVVILEKSSDIGGLWTFREKDYGVMRFTHINVSKYNYAFSDFPFPDNVPDYPHHSDMASYIKSYAENFGLFDLIQFNTAVSKVEQIGEKWRVTGRRTISPDNAEDSEEQVYVCSNVAVTTGHHAKPSWPEFRGQNTFPGKIIHSVEYNDAIYNECVGKRVLVVGIGNSAVDVAVDLATVGRCPSVYISTRSGAWIIPNYIFGEPTDLYANRILFMMPRTIANFVFENVTKLISGSPFKWGLNPKMAILSTQPTVSPTLIHHIQRQNIRIAPNITHIEGSSVHFVNGKSADFDQIIFCTGYNINLPFLPESISSEILDGGSNKIKLYKNVFAPSLGSGLAFIGFVQPASGGILSMSEIQARWFSKLCKKRVSLPSKEEMKQSIEKEFQESKQIWYQTPRHTIQKDPMVYNDEIAAMIGAKPDLVSNPFLAPRLLFSSCGVSQWRLNGPNKWEGASREVCKVPIPAFWYYSGCVFAFIVFYVAYTMLKTFLWIFGF